MKRWFPIALLVFLGASLLLLLWLILAPKPAAQVQALQAAPSGPSVKVEPKIENPAMEETPQETASSPAGDLPEIVPAGKVGSAPRRRLENSSGPEVAPGLTPAVVLENMRSVIRDYAGRFGSNPFGNNREITERLNGGNLKQVVFLKSEDGMRVNERGELIDNWGTPFFFHQVSGTEMEIRSAGPDRRMWTPDDLTIK